MRVDSALTNSLLNRMGTFRPTRIEADRAGHLVSDHVAREDQNGTIRLQYHVLHLKDTVSPKQSWLGLYQRLEDDFRNGSLGPTLMNAVSDQYLGRITDKEFQERLTRLADRYMQQLGPFAGEADQQDAHTAVMQRLVDAAKSINDGLARHLNVVNPMRGQLMTHASNELVEQARRGNFYSGELPYQHWMDPNIGAAREKAQALINEWATTYMQKANVDPTSVDLGSFAFDFQGSSLSGDDLKGLVMDVKL